MRDVDYKAWAKYLVDTFKKHDVHPKTILDIACGTGNITIPMAQMGYKVTGIDISESMLSVAENKTRMNGLKVRFIRQDMVDLKVREKFDAVICGCDGINYVIDDGDLVKTFTKIYDILNDDGIFIFDISSFYKLKHILGNNTLFQEREGICYCWENEFDEDKFIVTMVLNFFVPVGQLYRRFEEIHQQKAYDVETIINKLRSIGFTKVSIYDEFTFVKPRPQSMRIFFAVQK